MMRSLYILLTFSLIVSTALPQEKSPIPEFFGFYAVENGKSFSIHEGQGTGSAKLKTVEFYSYWDKGILRNDVPEISSKSRFILFYSNAGEMIKDMSLHQLPLLHNSIETPDLLEQQRAEFQHQTASNRIVASPNKPLFAKIPELEFKLLSKPVPNQLQMIEIVPASSLAAGLYVIDYAKGAQGREGWYAIFAVSSDGEQKPFCIDLVVEGGMGGQFWGANSPLANSVPSLSNGQYRHCSGEAPSSSQMAITSKSSGVPASQASCTDLNSCMQAGHDAFSSSDWTTAIADFQTASNKKPDSGEPLIWLGNADLSGGRRDDFSVAWNKAIRLGSTLTLRVCHNRSSQPCEMGDLMISSNKISFVGPDNQQVFSGTPSDINVSRRSGETRFTLKSGKKNYGFEFAPFAMECQPMQWLMCSDDAGVRQQQAVGAYILQLIPMLTNGSSAARQ